MDIISYYKNRIKAWRKAEKELPDVSKLQEEEKVRLEKGDLRALLIAGFINFVLPILLMCAAICFIAYFLLAML